jgi:phosphoribosylformylglycinamidine cyclo-ligase
MELYVDQSVANSIIEISKSFGVDAKIIGKVEANDSKKLSIVSDHGTFEY